MAEDLEEEIEAGEDAGEEGGASAKKHGKKMLFIIIGAAVLVVIGGLAGAWFTGLLDPVVAMITGKPAETAASKEGAKSAGDVVFLDLPEMLVNLNTGGRKAAYLKMRVSLELQNQQDVPKVEALMTRITDAFNVFLRELRVDDLKGSAGMYRLREEMLARVGAAVAPVKVNDVLFKEMLVQ